jgi:D-alanyl-D-alanine carboxypeptidase
MTYAPNGGGVGAPAQSAAQQPPPGTRPGVLGVLPGRNVAASTDPVASVTASSTVPGAPAPETRHSGWVIQIGAFPAEDEAKERLKSAQALAKRLLERADPFTERVVKGEVTLYRARFAGLDENRAEAACKHLKRNKVDCFAIKN